MTVAREPSPGRSGAAAARLRGLAAAVGVALIVALVLFTVARLATLPPEASPDRSAGPAAGQPGPELLPAAGMSPDEEEPVAEAPPTARVEIAERRLPPQRPQHPVAVPSSRKAGPAAEEKPPAVRPPVKPPVNQTVGPAIPPEPARTDAPAASPGKPPEGQSSVADEPDVPAKPVEQPEALYPAGAAAEDVTGTVRLRVVVGRRGEVEAVQVVRTSGDDRLDEAAVDAVWHWRYRPARRDGRPVRVTDYVEVEFYQESEDRPED